MFKFKMSIIIPQFEFEELKIWSMQVFLHWYITYLTLLNLLLFIFQLDSQIYIIIKLYIIWTYLKWNPYNIFLMEYSQIPFPLGHSSMYIYNATISENVDKSHSRTSDSALPLPIANLYISGGWSLPQLLLLLTD